MSDKPISVELRGVTQEYPAPDGSGVVRVVEDVNLTLDQPGIYMLLGPSGSGKSTILRMMGGVRPIGVKTPTAGEVLIHGDPCHGAHDDAVMVFQRYANRPDLTVRQNVAFPFRLKLWKKRVPKEEQERRIKQILEAVGLADKAELRPSQLSGGQNQRVALARALVLQPKVLLMDEPFGALDAQTREEMQLLLVELFNLQPCIVIFVTHDVTEALLLGDRVVVLSTRPAKVALNFEISEPRPRSSLWQRSTAAQKLQEQVLQQLHDSGKGQVRVSV
ncbi:MAG: ABC-type nitrate/sulfonate/bicarbonate transport system ATPase subunit [Myxococcota bacterium]|jgi:ABC-type nitrate/sulfonate/bicarbonate transport system ATPase subunit